MTMMDFFIEATFFEIVKEGFNGIVQIVGCLEVAIDCFIFGLSQWGNQAHRQSDC